MNETLEVSFEGPEEYKITPVQSRRHYSTTPPVSPTSISVPITVHYPTSPIHKPVSPVLKPAIATTPTKGTRHVQFASSILDPPPIPPRSIRLSSFSSCTVETALITSPPPLSAPPTSPPLSFFQDPPLPAHVSFSARNPFFRRFSSSSSENDINSMFKRDSTEEIETSSSFASDGELFPRQK